MGLVELDRRTEALPPVVKGHELPLSFARRSLELGLSGRMRPRSRSVSAAIDLVLLDL